MPPVRADAEELIQEIVRTLDGLYGYAAVNAERLVGGATSHEEKLLAEIDPDFFYRIEADTAYRALRRSVSSALSQARSLLGTGFLEYGRAIGAPEMDVSTLVPRIKRFMHDNSLSVKTRGVTVSATIAAGGSNSGNGIANRLIVDRFAYPIERVYAETKSLRCVRDSFAGGVRNGREVFELRGEDPFPDHVDRTGSGIVQRIEGLDSRSGGVISNPSFDQDSGVTTDAERISGWVISGTPADYERSTTQTYRNSFASATAYSLKITGNGTIKQNFADRVRSVDPGRPYYAQIAVYKPTGVTGNIEVILGSSSTQVALSSLTNDAWTILRPSTGTTPGGDENNFYQNWKQQDSTFGIQTSSLSGGSVYVDDCILAPYTEVADGTWIAIVGGSTAFLYDNDTFSYTDTATDTGLLQYWFVRSGYGEFPSTTGTPTWLDPA